MLKSSDMDQMTEFMLRNMASEKLGINLSLPHYKKFVRGVVESFLSRKEETQEANEEAREEEQEEEEEDSKKKGEKEYDDDGALIICRVRRVCRNPNPRVVSLFFVCFLLRLMLVLRC